MKNSGLIRAAGSLDADAAGHRAYALAEDLYPIARSITGDGVRQTLRRVRESLELADGDTWTTHEVASGEEVLDWVVPPEWNVREAWIKGPSGAKVVDFADHNLHLLSYSKPVHQRMSLAALQEHLYSLPDQPTLIPYRTSYYSPRWGFCLPHAQREALGEGEYEVFVDSSLEDGSLTYGELFFPGQSEREILLSTHVCHPSLANDNLSGIAVLSQLAAVLAGVPKASRRFSYRLLFVPGTIGAICWLARNHDCRSRVAHGLVCANLGDPGTFHYKKSRSGAAIDVAVAAAMKQLGAAFEQEDFSPFGYDERQYCSPGFDLPMGSFSRTPWGRYPQYHTSADDLEFIAADHLGGSCRALLTILAALEADVTFRNLAPFGEPQLGKRGLYSNLGGGSDGRERELARLWMLNLSDGAHSLLEISRRSGIGFLSLATAATELAEASLLQQTEKTSGPPSA